MVVRGPNERTSSLLTSWYIELTEAAYATSDFLNLFFGNERPPEEQRKMSSANGKMDVDISPNRKSSRNHSTDTHRTRRSHRSDSKEKWDRHRERDRDTEERRRRSRDRGSERDYRDRDRRSRSRERSHRDRDRERERDRRHRTDRRDEEGRYRSHDERDRERRRKRDDDRSLERDPERSKRKKHEEIDDPLALKDSPQSRTSNRRERSPERRYDRRARDPRDEFDDPPRYLADGARRDSKRPPSDDDTLEDELDTRSLRRTPPEQVKRPSPTYEAPVEDYNPDEPKEDDSEARSVFVSQLAARLTARDLGYFFEDKLGESTVVDARIVTDRISRRSKGIGYVEFRTVELVERALALTGTIVMGLPIMIQLTEAERNRLHPGDGNLNLPPGVNTSHGAMQLYVGSLHFNLTESDIRQVFEPFGELAFVDLHRDPMTGRSKGYAFIQYKRGEDAKMALEQMEGFELAGRTLRVNTVHEKGSVRYTQQDSLDEAGGGNLNAASRQALMQKLARIEAPPKLPPANKPSIPQTMQSRSVLLKNMFHPEEETDRDWDKELGEDVKGECEEKYGKVDAIKVERDSQGEIYLKFAAVESAKKAIQGLNGRWFGGRQITATYISDAIMMAHQ